MNDHNENIQLPPELEALDARLADLGRAERATAPAELEARIVAATNAALAAHGPALRIAPQTRAEPVGLLGRLSVRRLDWPMRVAAVIAVMIGGWAVIHGINGTQPSPTKLQPAQFNPDEVFDYVFARSGTSEQIQRLLLDTAQLETLVGGDDPGDPEIGDQENL
jgi:hypothetical protein